MSDSSPLKGLFHISLPVADAILNWANVFLVLGGLMTVTATVTVIWATGVRERYADERISANELMTAKAKSDAADARALTASIETENLKLQARVEEERAARLLIEERLSPRRLTSDQKIKLAVDLAPFHGQKIRVLSPHNTEGNEYAIDFIEVFRRAGWVVVESSTSTGVAFIEYDVEPRGIQLEVAPNDPPAVHAAAQALSRSLGDQNLRQPDEPVRPTQDRTDGWIDFGVGLKPLPK